MTEKQIENEINDEIRNFNDSDYKGKLPSWYVDVFKNVLMEVGMDKQKISTKFVKTALGKKKLSNLEVRMMNNIIIGAPMRLLSSNFEEALKRREVIENMIVDANLEVKEFDEKIKQKRITLLQLSGAGRKIIS